MQNASTSTVIYDVYPGAPVGWRATGIASGQVMPVAWTPTTGGVGFLVGVTQRAMAAGTVFNDLNGNGAPDAGEPPLPGWQVITDDNNNAKFDDGERIVRTNAKGRWTFSSLPGGHDFTFRLIRKDGFAQTLPASGAPIAMFLARGAAPRGLLFATRA